MTFKFICRAKAVKGDWFFGPGGGLFPWTWDEYSKKVHDIYELVEGEVPHD